MSGCQDGREGASSSSKFKLYSKLSRACKTEVFKITGMTSEWKRTIETDDVAFEIVHKMGDGR